jgi:glycosyltransferase involved in cell wall biosynthesis
LPSQETLRGFRVALVFSNIGGGGMEHSMLRLAEALLARGLTVDLVVGDAKGELRCTVPREARLFELDKVPLWRGIAAGAVAEPATRRLVLGLKIKPLKPLVRRLPSLVAYLRAVGPHAVLAAEPRYNAMAVWARRLSGLRSRVVISERNQPSLSEVLWRERQLQGLLRAAYLKADAIVAVSDGVADDLARHATIERARITTVYNPVVGPDLLAKAREPLDHPWFGDDRPPVILSVGRLHPQKDFATLLRAFAAVRARRPARLVILGAASQLDPGHAEQLKTLAQTLGVADDVDMPGFVDNPFAFMARAAVFVLSSRYEGLPGVLIQALACGCPVVSTDCPSGPAEILDHGRFGPLVPVGDDAGLARAIGAVLDDPPPSARLQARAELFNVQQATDRYLELLFPAARPASCQ